MNILRSLHSMMKNRCRRGGDGLDEALIFKVIFKTIMRDNRRKGEGGKGEVGRWKEQYVEFQQLLYWSE